MMIDKIIEARVKDLGGFSVRRVIPFVKQRMVGPWIFFDHMGPANFPAGEGIDVRPHPHINLATVTYLFEGEIWHRDSLGNSEPIKPGDINLMVAGKGIVHSERTREELKENGQQLHGLQLWLALPEKDEEVDPAFYHYDSAEIPAIDVDGVPVRVMIGHAYGLTSPVKTFSETLYVEARLQAGQSLVIPEASELAVYSASGSISCAGEKISEYSMAVFAGGTKGVEIEAQEEAFVAFVGGAPLGERHLFWNFVSSRKARLEEAKKMWKNKEFPLVPGDEDEFIPLPE